MRCRTSDGYARQVVATVHIARSPLPRRLPPGAWTVLAWCGAIAYLAVIFVPSRNTPSGVAAILPALATGLLAGLLRRHPLATLALMLIGSCVVALPIDVAGGLFGYASWEAWSLQFVAVDIAVAVIAATRPRRVSIIAVAMALVVQVGSALVHRARPDVFVAYIALAALATVTAWMIGNSVRQRRVYAEALRAQVTVQAVTAERLRIARELHDMIAHTIGIIAIQAGVGARVIDTQPDEARNALAAIEVTSRETLAGLRRTLGSLRRTEAGPESQPAPLDPAPGLGDLDRLAATTTDAGVRVDVRWRGARRPLPADIELSAFRIIQEAITNVVRHADVHDCHVTVDYRDEELAIEVVDGGRGCVVAGTGYGIIGMRERVGLLHGQLTAAPRPEGGFRVAARLPAPAAP